jgi:selenocysteine-specific elongation factor
MTSPQDNHHRILATAGHVDHGKSSLVLALTGTDPDRLPDEKRRGMTIDLGFASLLLDDPASQTPCRLGIVDVPGHEDFIRNMIAGVGSIDVALLTVAADDGWMPQTEEHLRILSYLHAPALVVALTKADLSSDLAPLITDISARLATTPFANARIIPVSVRTGAGLAELRTALLDALRNAPPPRDIAKPRLFIDRVFSLKGAGTVVTGTLTGGQLLVGQTVALHPFHGAAGAARIRAIQSHNRNQDAALPSSRVALNLVDIHLPHPVTSLARGHVVTLPSLATSSQYLDVLLSPNATVHHQQTLWVHHATTSTRARLLLHPAIPRVAQLRLDSPLLPFLGDQLLLRDAAARTTLCGATVLRIHAQRHRFSDDPMPELLRDLAANPSSLSRHLLLSLTDHPGTSPETLLSASHWSTAAIARAASDLLAAKKLHQVQNGGTLPAAYWTDLKNRITSILESFHKQHPEEVGIPPAALQKQVEKLPPAIFDALLDDPAFRRRPVGLSLQSHRPPLPLHLAPLCRSILETLERTGINPPCRSELAPTLRARTALQHLVDRQDVVPLNADIVLSITHYESAKRRILAYLETHPSTPIPQLKSHLQTTRRILIPLLESLDRQGLTRRKGDTRELAAAPTSGSG